IKIFKRMGLTPIGVRADTGPIGGNLSHEFHILANTGESTLHYDNKFSELLESEDIESLKSIYAVADDMHDPKICPIPQEQLNVSKGIEIGHIFYFGNKYSKPMKASVTSQDGKNVNMHMGSYGIGVSRLVGAIIEAFHDDKGIIWPEAVAPFKVGLINLQTKVTEAADKIYKALKSDEVLYDDTDESVGVKFARMDLIGLPWQIIIGKKAVTSNIVEVKNRATGEVEEIQVEEAINRFSTK
ncbi:MAG: His/Gly/Thr/Pro-type tRNA ligase C-terminal domain-containing protein, partial [Wolbachia sp.]